jgi:hypothetical protein
MIVLAFISSMTASLCLLASLTALLTNIIVLSINLLLQQKSHRGRSSAVFVTTKLLIVPLIALVWWQIAAVHDWRVIAYMFLAWVGDAGLLADVDRTLTEFVLTLVGVSGFLLSHIMIILYFDVHWGNIPAWAVLFLLPGLALFARLVPKMRARGLGGIFVIVYCCWLQGANAMSIAQLCSSTFWTRGPMMCSLGYFFFLLSDSFLIAKEFGVDQEMRRFEIMSTYAIAQTLIILGCGMSTID